MTKANIIRLLVLLIALLDISLGSYPAYAEDTPSQQHLYEMKYIPAKVGQKLWGQPLVHVRLNGHLDATFLVDTGSGDSIISTDLARRLNLRLRPAVGDNGQPIFWRNDRATMTEIARFEIGPVNADNAPVLVADASTFNQIWGKVNVNTCDGVIGANMLQNSAILLDSQHHTFGFCVPGQLSSKQLQEVGLPIPYVLPMSKSDDTGNNQWHIQAQFINGSKSGNESLLLDTGSNATIVSDSLAHKAQIMAISQGKQQTLYANSAITMGRVDLIKIGDLILSSVSIGIRPVTDEQPPLLGMDILANYRVLIDFPGKKMYLQPNTPSVTITVKPQPAPPSQMAQP